jgi:hypothetical protein
LAAEIALATSAMDGTELASWIDSGLIDNVDAMVAGV